MRWRAEATHQLVPALPRFLERYPEVQVDVVLDDRTVDLVKEGADIAVRTGPLRDPSLIARKLGELRRVICASPVYLARHGVPRFPDELAKHDCITLGFRAPVQWLFKRHPASSASRFPAGSPQITPSACCSWR